MVPSRLLLGWLMTVVMSDAGKGPVAVDVS
jgi:hypothetical protein